MKKMNKTNLFSRCLVPCSLVALAFLPLSAALAGGSLRLLAPGSNDLTTGTLIVPSSLKEAGLSASRERVSFGWALDETAVPVLDYRPAEQVSREYWMPVTNFDLNAGLELNLTSENALVRISSMVGADRRRSEPVDPRDLVLVNQHGQNFGAGSGMELMVTPEDLEIAGGEALNFQTTAFRVHPTVGSGVVVLFTDRIDLQSERQYLVQVSEPDSEVTAGLVTTRDTYFAGQTVVVTAAMRRGSITLEPDEISGQAIAPDGRVYPLDFRPGTVQGRFRVIGDGDGATGLWQVRVSVRTQVDGMVVPRDVHTAFAVAAPTARLSGGAEIASDPESISATLAVTVAQPGRYEVRGLLYGTNENGILEAVSVAQTADWLETGDGELMLNFDRSLVKDAGLSAPLEIRDLRLIHQDRLSLLHRQAVALKIDRLD